MKSEEKSFLIINLHNETLLKLNSLTSKVLKNEYTDYINFFPRFVFIQNENLIDAEFFNGNATNANSFDAKNFDDETLNKKSIDAKNFDANSLVEAKKYYSKATSFCINSIIEFENILFCVGKICFNKDNKIAQIKNGEKVNDLSEVGKVEDSEKLFVIPVGIKFLQQNNLAR